MINKSIKWKYKIQDALFKNAKRLPHEWLLGKEKAKELMQDLINAKNNTHIHNGVDISFNNEEILKGARKFYKEP